MDLQTNQQTVSDDQELAKVLAGISQDADGASLSGIAAAQAPVMPPVATDNTDTNTTTLPDVAASAEEPTPTPEVSMPEITAPDAPTPTPTTDVSLNDIKQTALMELRPLVDKLDVSPEEKFDTYLLLLRSTDDRDLIAPAHDAAVAIADETRKAQALLDIIKEIDYLSSPKQ